MRRIILTIGLLLALLTSCALRYEVRVEQQEVPYPESHDPTAPEEHGVFIIIEIKHP